MASPKLHQPTATKAIERKGGHVDMSDDNSFTEPVVAGQLSPDGRFRWNGERWEFSTSEATNHRRDVNGARPKSRRDGHEPARVRTTAAANVSKRKEEE